MTDFLQVWTLGLVGLIVPVAGLIVAIRLIHGIGGRV